MRARPVRARAAGWAAGFEPLRLPVLRSVLGRSLGWRWVRGQPQRDPWLRRGAGLHRRAWSPSLSFLPPLRVGDPPLGPNKSPHFCFSPPFFAVVIEDDRIDDVLKNMTDKAPPGV